MLCCRGVAARLFCLGAMSHSVLPLFDFLSCTGFCFGDRIGKGLA